MIRDVRYLVSGSSTYGELQDLLIEMPRLRAFPVVDNRGDFNYIKLLASLDFSESMILLGSVSRRHLLHLLESNVGETARMREVDRRRSLESADNARTNLLDEGITSSNSRSVCEFILSLGVLNNKFCSASLSFPCHRHRRCINVEISYLRSSTVVAIRQQQLITLTNNIRSEVILLKTIICPTISDYMRSITNKFSTLRRRSGQSHRDDMDDAEVSASIYNKFLKY
jgi:hypothetical protein